MNRHARSEQVADYLGEHLEFLTYQASISALLALLTGMQGEQALAFTALNLPVGMLLLLGLGMASTLPFTLRLPASVLLLTLGALSVLALGGDWVEPLPVWALYGLLAIEVAWQARPRRALAIR